MQPSGVPSPARDALFEREALACLPDVARFARSLTRDVTQAEDLVQETFLRAYAGYASFQTGSNVRRWLFSICHHAWLRIAQREQRVTVTESGDDADLEVLSAVREQGGADSRGFERLVRDIDVGPAIRRAIDELAPAFRCTVQLVDVEGLSYEEAAEILDIPTGTVRSRLFRARRILQQHLVAHARDLGVLPPVAHPVSSLPSGDQR